jgi:hypothetical protein
LGPAVKARGLIGSGTFDPATLKALYKAFDDAWEQIATHVSSSADAVEAARMKLANIVLGLGQNGAQDAQAITDTAVQLMLADPTQLRRRL